MLLSYERAFEGDDDLHFDEVCMKDILDDMISLNLRPDNFSVTYERYIRAGRMMIEHKADLSLCMNLGREASATKPLGIMPLDDAGPSTSSKYHNLLSEHYIQDKR